MRPLTLSTALTAVLAAGTPAPAGAAAGVTPTATGNGGAVASMDVNASRAGIDALRRGGNAVDAAVATASALGVTVPFVAGPGGGGFMVVYNARTHRVTTIDGREACPAACKRRCSPTRRPASRWTTPPRPISRSRPGSRRWSRPGTGR